jgi:hypothetical protein
MEVISNKPSGYGTMQIGGVENRPFHIGIQQGELFCRMPERRDAEGRPMSLQAYGELFGLEALRTLSFSIGDLRDFVYSALVSGAEVDGLPFDYSPAQVGYWLDEADDLEASKPMRELVRQFQVRFERQQERSKNGTAPLPKTEAGAKKKASKQN